MGWSGLKAEVRDAFGTGALPGRILAVQGARGVAMSLVFLVHLLELLCGRAPRGSVDSRVLDWIYPLVPLHSESDDFRQEIGVTHGRKRVGE